MTIFASRAGSTANATLLAALAVFLLASCGGNDEPPKSDATEDVATDVTEVDGDNSDAGDAQADAGQDAADTGGTDAPTKEDVLTARSLRFNENFSGIWGTGPDNIWWVGAQGRVLHYNGSVLVPRDAGTSKDLYAVWGRSADDVWVAGDGVVLQYNGSKWLDRTPPELTGVVFRAVHAPSDNSTVLIGGDDGVILRVLDNGKIVKDDTNSALRIRGLKALSAGNVWAVGDKGQALRLNGGTWASVPLPKANEDLHGLSNSEDGRLFTVGINGFVAATENKVWEATLTNDPKSRDLYAVWAVSDKEAWSVGKEGALIHHIGTKWNLRDIDGTYMKTKTFRAVWGQTSEPLFAFAIGDKGAGIRYDSEADKWLDFRAETTAHLNAANGLKDGRVVVAGDGGVLLEAADGQADFVDLGVQVTGANLRDVCDDGQGGFFAVGDGGVTVAVDAKGAQTVSVVEDASGQRLTGATLVGGEIVAVGHGGIALRRGKTGWVSETTGAQFNLNAIAASGDEAWAVGEFGTIVRRNADGTWSKEASGESFNLHRVVVWDDGAAAVGDNGLVLVRDKDGWKKVFESPGLFLYGVSRRADGLVVAVGWKGTLVVGQGDNWKKVESGLPNVLLDVALTSKGGVVVGHKGGVYQISEALK